MADSTRIGLSQPAEASVTEVAAWLCARKRLLLLTHERPDGDAIGSLLGLGHALRGAGIDCTAALCAPPPRRYTFLSAAAAGFLSVGPLACDCDAVDGVVCLDVSTRARLELPPGVAWSQLAAKPLCLVDHHGDNEKFGGLNWVVPGKTATAQLIVDLCRYAGWTISADCAACLLVGLIMDSGGFQFANTTAGVLRDAAALIDAGADHAAVMDALFFHEPFGRRVLAARLVQNARFEIDRRFAYAVLPPEWLRELAVSASDTEGLIDALRAIDGVDICCLISPEPGAMRVSLRSRSPLLRVDEVAHALGGGGHPLAAGAKLSGQPLADVEARVLNEVRKVLS
jgi:phosphoesterase RecJ-like protein